MLKDDTTRSIKAIAKICAVFLGFLAAMYLIDKIFSAL